MKGDNPYISEFGEYIVAAEPDIRERANAWRTAIGLQQVDRLSVSDYLKQTAKRNIEGEITIDQTEQLIRTYYQNKSQRLPDDDDIEEADRVAINITRILGEQSFTFSAIGLINIHRHIFKGVFKHAGKLRTNDITKKEWILNGDTVLYSRWQDLERTITYDIGQEKQFNYSGLNTQQIADHLANFTAGLWQIHPFNEGNTRTTAIFIIKYLRSIGYVDVDNKLFEQHSWYFRNALVRANYRNVSLGIEPENKFLVIFFINLLFGGTTPLHNRYLHINWRSTTPATTPTTTPATSNIDDKIISLITVLGDRQLSCKQLMLAMGLRDRKNFVEYTLAPAIKMGYIDLLYPNTPNHPRQKYILTDKGCIVIPNRVEP